MTRHALMFLPLLIAAGSVGAHENPIAHDAEYYILGNCPGRQLV